MLLQEKTAIVWNAPANLTPKLRRISDCHQKSRPWDLRCVTFNTLKMAPAIALPPHSRRSHPRVPWLVQGTTGRTGIRAEKVEHELAISRTPVGQCLSSSVT